MIVEVCVSAVCLAGCALIAAKTAKEVLGFLRDRTPPKAEKNDVSDEQKRAAERARREMENFMNYDGRVSEDRYDQN